MISIPIIVGLIAVGVALLERGYKRYLEEKKIQEAEGKTISFDLAYMVNMLVTAGGSAAIVAVIPVVIEEIGAPTQITMVSLILNAILGYTTAYRILDGMNNSTDIKRETATEIRKNTSSSSSSSTNK